jgi:glucosamine-6-phosphate deaminase
MTAAGSLRLHVVGEKGFGMAAATAVLQELPGFRPRLGVATGETPLPLYRELARKVRNHMLDLHDATVVALDEYVGLDRHDPHSYSQYVRTLIEEPLGIADEHVVVPDGRAVDPNEAATALDRHVEALGGIDVQIVGIGANGHIGFNEPGSPLDSPARVVTLSEQTRSDNSRFFEGCIADVPTMAITQGLATILRARTIVLLAYGVAKATAASEL